jgi:hypothetical protein
MIEICVIIIAIASVASAVSLGRIEKCMREKQKQEQELRRVRGLERL